MNRTFFPLSSWLSPMLMVGLGAAQAASSSVPPAPVPVAATAAASAAGAATVTDRSLPKHTSELLDVAFAAASALPLDPHVKTRCLAQESVVTACLALDQPARAEQLTRAIGNWRRGASLADVALYLAQHGAADAARARLEQAARLADDGLADPNTQAWRRDRVRAKIASAYLVLGQPDKAAEFTEAALPAEAGRVQATKAQLVAADAYDEQVKLLDDAIGHGDFDQVQGAFSACVQLFVRFYDDADRRGAMQQRVAEAYPKLPSTLRIGFLSQLVRTSVEHGDHDQALALVDRIYDLIDKARWRPQDHIRLLAGAAELRFLAGDQERARKDIAVARAMYDQARKDIQTLERAGVLRPVAEALQAAGDAAGALAAYHQVADDGAENPNARPRAVDLTATCVSMALHGVEPDQALASRLREICKGLRDPW